MPTYNDNSDDDVNPQAAGEQEEDASGVSESPEAQTLKKFRTADQQAKWSKELEAERKEHKDYITTGSKTIDVYTDKRDAKSKRMNYNLFFANTETILASLYAQTPSPDIKRRWNDPDDQASRVAATILTRNIEFELDTRGFDNAFKQMLFDRRVPGMGRSESVV